ncbi:MAG: hypothetical protein HeimC3_47190 [Candidatus Heimdallarchaeota archaeon LC_3]|nr:MAG: hypothetical protein HeimC3_47190 [Candidatus Heimdallarchaeota archaeon LC_3]
MTNPAKIGYGLYYVRNCPISEREKLTDYELIFIPLDTFYCDLIISIPEGNKDEIVRNIEDYSFFRFSDWYWNYNYTKKSKSNYSHFDLTQSWYQKATSFETQSITKITNKSFPIASTIAMTTSHIYQKQLNELFENHISKFYLYIKNINEDLMIINIKIKKGSVDSLSNILDLCSRYSFSHIFQYTDQEKTGLFGIISIESNKTQMNDFNQLLEKNIPKESLLSVKTMIMKNKSFFLPPFNFYKKSFNVKNGQAFLLAKSLIKDKIAIENIQIGKSIPYMDNQSIDLRLAVKKIVKGKIIVNYRIFDWIYCIIIKNKIDDEFQLFDYLSKNTMFSLRIRNSKEVIQVVCIPRREYFRLLKSTDYLLLTQLKFTKTDPETISWSEFVLPLFIEDAKKFPYTEWDLNKGNGPLSGYSPSVIDYTKELEGKNFVNTLDISTHYPELDFQQKVYLQNNIEGSFLSLLDDTNHFCLGILITSITTKKAFQRFQDFFLSFPFVKIFTNTTTNLILALIFIHQDLLPPLIENLSQIINNNLQIKMKMTEIEEIKNIKEYLYKTNQSITQRIKSF